MSLPLLFSFFSKPDCVWSPVTLIVAIPFFFPCWTWVILQTFPPEIKLFWTRIFINYLEHFYVYLRAPLGSSDHCFLKLMPKIYGPLSHISVTKDRYGGVRCQNCGINAILSLQPMSNWTDFNILYDPEQSLHVETLSSYLNFILDICCPCQNYYIRTDCFFSPNLK